MDKKWTLFRRFFASFKKTRSEKNFFSGFFLSRFPSTLTVLYLSFQNYKSKRFCINGITSKGLKDDAFRTEPATNADEFAACDK
jgi:hypothetical protein